MITRWLVRSQLKRPALIDSGATLHALDDDCMQHVIFMLVVENRAQIAKCAVVCSAWLALCKDAGLWRRMCSS